MTTLRVTRDQVRTVLVERVQAGEELATTQADIAERAGGWRDWLYLFSTWREHTTAELKAVYESEEEPQSFDAVTQTADRSSPQYTFPYSKSALNLGLMTLRSLVERLPWRPGASPGGRPWMSFLAWTRPAGTLSCREVRGAGLLRIGRLRLVSSGRSRAGQ
jgi:hypothetical protein